MNIITAAVVGVVLNLSIYLLVQVVFKGGKGIENLQIPHLAWILVSFLALYRFKINMIAWLGVSAVYGLGLYLIQSNFN
jgi:chromate transporter